MILSGSWARRRNRDLLHLSMLQATSQHRPDTVAAEVPTAVEGTALTIESDAPRTRRSGDSPLGVTQSGLVGHNHWVAAKVLSL